MTPEQQNILHQLAQMGDVVFVKNDGSRLILNEDGNIPLQTHEDAILYFLERLDSNMIQLILDKKHLSKEFDKKAFIYKITDAFEQFSKRGNTFLNRFEGKCTSGVCTNTNCIGFTFVGNKTNHYMDLILEIKENKVIDIYECSQFENENLLLSKPKDKKIMFKDY